MAGQGGFPESPKEIHVSALQERLLAVDDENYRFENIVYVYLTWEDTLANQAMIDSTDSYRNGTKDECFKPCASVEQNLPRKVPQGIYLPDVSCCDGVWLPDVGQMNVYELPEGRMQPYSIQITGNSVAWWTAIHGVYFTPMDFKRFPFDSQELVMQFSWQSIYAISAFVPSITATRFLIRGKGDTVSGWTVDSVSVRPRNFTSGGEMEYFLSQWGSSSAAVTDPYPLYLTKDEATKVQSRGGGNETVPVYADEGVEMVSFDIVIKIHRLWQYYLINIIVPVLLLVMLSLITYIIPPSSLDARIALNITLFLSLTALQFVVNDQLPKSSYPTAVTKLVLVSYIAVAFGVPETILVSALHNSATSGLDADEVGTFRGGRGGGNGRKGEGSMAGARIDEDEGSPRSLSLVMKVFKRKKGASKAAFFIDMASLFAVFVTILISTILLLTGV